MSVCKESLKPHEFAAAITADLATVDAALADARCVYACVWCACMQFERESVLGVKLIYVYICTCVCMHACMYGVCMYVCMWVGVFRGRLAEYTSTHEAAISTGRST